MMDQKNIQDMCKWVYERIPEEIVKNIGVDELRQTVAALAVAAGDAQSTFLIPDLFPGFKLNVLYIHDIEGTPSQSAMESSTTTWTPGLSARALGAIGSAVSSELHAKGCDMLRCAIDGAEVIVFQPHVQPLVLQATGTTLLTQFQ